MRNVRSWSRRLAVIAGALAIVALFVGQVSSADARGGGRSGAGAAGRGAAGAKRGKKEPKGQVAVDRLIHDTFRRNVVARSRYVSW